MLRYTAGMGPFQRQMSQTRGSGINKALQKSGALGPSRGFMSMSVCLTDSLQISYPSSGKRSKSSFNPCGFHRHATFLVLSMTEMFYLHLCQTQALVPCPGPALCCNFAGVKKPSLVEVAYRR